MSTTKKTTPTISAKFELNQWTIDSRQPCTPHYVHLINTATYTRVPLSPGSIV